VTQDFRTSGRLHPGGAIEPAITTPGIPVSRRSAFFPSATMTAPKNIESWASKYLARHSRFTTVGTEPPSLAAEQSTVSVSQVFRSCSSKVSPGQQSVRKRRRFR
jgi:hypothetical protein